MCADSRANKLIEILTSFITRPSVRVEGETPVLRFLLERVHPALALNKRVKNMRLTRR